MLIDDNIKGLLENSGNGRMNWSQMDVGKIHEEHLSEGLEMESAKWPSCITGVYGNIIMCNMCGKIGTQAVQCYAEGEGWLQAPATC